MKPPMPFVAQRKLPAAPAPMRPKGLRRWLRENLFGSTGNTLLTLLTAALLLWLGHGLWQWGVSRAVWEAASAAACREMVTTRHGPGASGACWAVITAEADRLLHGAYPEALRWRVNAALGLLVIAAVPPIAGSIRPLVTIAATVMAAKLLWIIGAQLAGAEPVAGFGPTTVILATGGVLAFAFGRPDQHRIWLLASAAFPVVFNALIWGGLPGLDAVPATRISGGVLTLLIVINAYAAALVLGFALALGLWSAPSLPRRAARAMIAALQTIPPVPLLLFALLGLRYLLPPGAEAGLVLRVTVVLAAVTAAEMARALETGLRAVPGGQVMAARALGLAEGRILGSVILPQAIDRATPNLLRALARLVRNSTLVVVVGLSDLLAMAAPRVTGTQWQGAIVELYGFIAAIFLTMTMGLAYLARRLDARQTPCVRRRGV